MLATPSDKLPGDRLQNAAPGEPVDMWIYSAFPKDHWVARKAADFTHVEHPGTAIKIENNLYEIVTIQETAEPGYQLRYGLKKWEPQHTARHVIRYTPQTQAQSAADYLEEAHTQALRARILWLFPLAGLAPDTVQRAWEKRTTLNMALVSAGSAMMFLGLAYTLHVTLGRSQERPALLALIYYLALESFARLLWIVTSGKPHGSLLLALPYLLWEAVAQPEERARKKEEWLKFSFEGDEVMRRPGSGYLVIRSMLFDDILAGTQPVRFEGAVYQTLHWHKEGKGLVRRWVYELEKTIADPSKGKYREYTHPRSPERQKAVEAYTHRLDLTQSFALLWGAYPRREQLRLEIKYQFAAAKFTAITAGFLLAAAVLQIWASVLWHTTVYALVGPIYLVFESLYRLYQSKVHGQPAGSLAGYVLGLFIHSPE